MCGVGRSGGNPALKFIRYSTYIHYYGLLSLSKGIRRRESHQDDMSNNRYAFATLVTSDHYLPGALALAAALKEVHTPSDAQEVPFDTVCIVTPETVDVKTIKLLRRAFDVVVGVEVIEEKNEAGLKLLGKYL